MEWLTMVTQARHECEKYFFSYCVIYGKSFSFMPKDWERVSTGVGVTTAPFVYFSVIENYDTTES